VNPSDRHFWRITAHDRDTQHARCIYCGVIRKRINQGDRFPLTIYRLLDGCDVRERPRCEGRAAPDSAA
jgi:hypothetical protein